MLQNGAAELGARGVDGSSAKRSGGSSDRELRRQSAWCKYVFVVKALSPGSVSPRLATAGMMFTIYVESCCYSGDVRIDW